MEILFTHLEASVEAIRQTSCLMGVVVLLLALTIYMIRAQTPWDYSVGLLKVFIFMGLCLCSNGVFQGVEEIGMAVAQRIEPKIATDPFQFANNLLISQETAAKIDKLAEQKEKPKEGEQKQANAEKKNIVFDFGKKAMDGFKSLGSAMLHPIESGQRIVSGFYASIFKSVIHIASWIGALIVIVLMVMQYAICVVLRMFLPLAFACLAIPALVQMGMNVLLTCINVVCWPIGFAIVQKMIGSILFDTQIAGLLGNLAGGKLPGEVMIHAFGILAVACLSTFGYLAVPKIVAMFVGGGIASSGLSNAMSSMLGGAVGAGMSKMTGGASSAGMHLGQVIKNWATGANKNQYRESSYQQKREWAESHRKEYLKHLAK